jgi:hypothetical protein
MWTTVSQAEIVAPSQAASRPSTLLRTSPPPHGPASPVRHRTWWAPGVQVLPHRRRCQITFLPHLQEATTTKPFIIGLQIHDDRIALPQGCVGVFSTSSSRYNLPIPFLLWSSHFIRSSLIHSNVLEVARNAARDNKKPPLCRSAVSCLLRRPHDLGHSLPCGLMASVYPFNRSVPCLWRHYFQIIFVMDNNGREPVVEARDELHRMLNEVLSKCPVHSLRCNCCSN